MAPNGKRFDGWLLNTVDNRFPQKGDFDGDRRSELLVTSPWGIGVLKRYRTTYRESCWRQTAHGSAVGCSTQHNTFGPVGDFDGDGRKEILVRSPWGIGLLKLTNNPSRPTPFSR